MANRQEQLTIRRSHTVSPFGVGAIYSIRGESIVAVDTKRWRSRGTPLRAPRLAESLHVEMFMSAPTGDVVGIPYVRFPKWLFCPGCRAMVFWEPSMEVEGEAPMCGACKGNRRLVPMRFVLACQNGHLGEVPWDRWAHSRTNQPAQRQCQSRALRFVTSGGGGSLEFVRVACSTCEASRSLQGLTSQGAMQQVGWPCVGRQPWEATARAEECREDPRALLRGAGNVHFSHVSSALDIPPDSDYSIEGDVVERVTTHSLFDYLASAEYRGDPSPMQADAAATIAAEFTTGDVARVWLIVEDERRKRSGGTVHQPASENQIAVEEWVAFQAPDPNVDDRSTFVARQVDFPSDERGSNPVVEELFGLVERVVVVDKLREVRAMTAFSRFEYGHREVPPDLDRSLGWYPAVEVFGEGVFLSLSEDRVREWEQQSEVMDRSNRVSQRLANSYRNRWLPDSSSRFVLLHTLAHLLMRQLAFECGYSSSALRERVFCGGADEVVPMAGILIYTSAGDTEGSLGGLARQGEPPRLAETLLQAVQVASWCSQDPICRESQGQGSDALNLAACHACTLVGETSCVHGNLLLDRVLVTGDSNGVPGYFEDLSILVITMRGSIS